MIVLCQDKTIYATVINMARIIDGNKMNLVGQNVKKYRKLRKMSQQLLSDKLETLAIYICRGSISRIEDFSRTVTDIELYGLSEVLGVPIEKLFDEVNDDK